MNIKEYLSAAVNDKVTCTPLTYYTTQEQEGSLPWEATTVLPPAPSQHRGSCPGPVTLGGCWVGGLPVRATPPRLSPPPAYHRARFTASRPFPNAVGPQTTWRFEAPHSTPSKIDLSLLTPPKTSPRLALSSGGGIGSSARPLAVRVLQSLMRHGDTATTTRAAACAPADRWPRVDPRRETRGHRGSTDAENHSALSGRRRLEPVLFRDQR